MFEKFPKHLKWTLKFELKSPLKLECKYSPPDLQTEPHSNQCQ